MTHHSWFKVFTAVISTTAAKRWLKTSHVVLVAFLLFSTLLWLLMPMNLHSQSVQIGSPPLDQPQRTIRATAAVSNIENYTPTHFTRDEALALYRAAYETAAPSLEWSGNRNLCQPGTTSQHYQDAVLARINYFRALAGVNPVVLDEEFNHFAQAAALLMSAAGDLSHYPPSSWPCYSTDGAMGAGNSNLALGLSGPEAIDLYMFDPGASNFPVGHRRWVLYPYSLRMGTGDIPESEKFRAANALWVLGPTDPDAPMRDGFVAWPPPTYLPYTHVAPRWSFSYPRADFTNTTAQVIRNGITQPITIHPIVNGYGLNTIVWEYEVESLNFRPAPFVDDLYVITLDDVMIDDVQQSFVYSISVVDVNQPPHDVRIETYEYGPDDLIFYELYENQPAGTVAGILSAYDPDGQEGEVITYTLMKDASDTDNVSFTIKDNRVRTNAVLDYEHQQAYRILVQADDGRENGTVTATLEIHVNNANDAPTGITLTHHHIAENSVSPGAIGLLHAHDQDMEGGLSSGNSHIFELVDGDGSQDNSLFQIVTGISQPELHAMVAFDYEEAPSHTVRIRTTDAEGATYTQRLTIEVQDINEPPYLIGNDTSISIAPNQASTREISFADPDMNDTVTLTVVSAPNFLRHTLVNENQAKLLLTPTTTDIGSHVAEIMLTDTAGRSTKIQFQIEVGKLSIYMPCLYR